MKKLFFTFLSLIICFNLFAGIIITRSEVGLISRELYYNNYFAEIENDLIVSIWDFNNFELTLINHPLRIYTTIDFDSFEEVMKKQNQAQIESELRSIDPDRQKLMADATKTLFRSMKPIFILADTSRTFGYKTYEYHVYNGDIIAQKLFISKEIQQEIDKEVNPVNIKRVESVFKQNRQNYFDAVGIFLDPVSSLVESIENVGYVVKRYDYGFRDRPNPDYEKEIESIVNEISEIKKTTIDPAIFTRHQRYRKMDYNAYQIAIIRAMEKQYKR